MGAWTQGTHGEIDLGHGLTPHALIVMEGYCGALGTWESKSTHTLDPAIPVCSHFPTVWLPE